MIASGQSFSMIQRRMLLFALTGVANEKRRAVMNFGDAATKEVVLYPPLNKKSNEQVG